jgi:signal transduction histidine kinase
VRIGVGYEKPANEEVPGRLIVNIDDDGPGLEPEQRVEATRRGGRLDESKPGSGLGLSIVTDLVALYEGKFSLDRSPAGGLRAAIELPAA